MSSAKDVIGAVKEIGNQASKMVFPVAKGILIEFELPTDAPAYYHLKNECEMWATTVQKGNAPFLPAYAASLPLEILRTCYYIHKMAVNPTFTQEEALELSQGGNFINVLTDSFVQQMRGRYVALEALAIEAMGEFLNLTHSSEPTSSSGETFSENTPDIGQPTNTETHETS